jgi:hypothetical protein
MLNIAAICQIISLLYVMLLFVVFVTGLIYTAVSTAAHQCTTIPANCFVHTFKYNLCSTSIPIDVSTRVSQYLKILGVLHSRASCPTNFITLLNKFV